MCLFICERIASANKYIDLSVIPRLDRGIQFLSIGLDCPVKPDNDDDKY
jgi:hypothetical protein